MGARSTGTSCSTAVNCVRVLGESVELSEEFKDNYERWLDQEVFGRQVDWDLMLDRC